MVQEGSISTELRAAGDRSSAITQAQKKNYAEILSRALASKVANALRPTFKGVLPTADGRGQESRARTSKGFKKLDVNYSTVELGLGLGISIKTVNFPDPRTNRYTKNFTRADGELRAEASDYHERQPWAVMVALVFMPLDACDDGRQAPSSFGQAVQVFRQRGGRTKPTDTSMLFERVFIGLYDTAPENFGRVTFFDVRNRPRRNGRPRETLTFAELLGEIVKAYDERNNPPMEWDDAPTEHVPLSVEDEDDE